MGLSPAAGYTEKMGTLFSSPPAGIVAWREAGGERGMERKDLGTVEKVKKSALNAAFSGFRVVALCF